MSSERSVKYWRPDRFTLIGSALPKLEPERGYAVVILNQPLANRSLLVKVCSGGSPRIRYAEMEREH